jgi:hypothetical protein
MKPVDHAGRTPTRGLPCRRTTTKTDYGVFDPDKFWGHVLSGPAATTDQPDAFDARVERAWRFMRTMFFTPEEHAALVEAMVQMITQKQGPKQFSTTRSRCPKRRA